MRRLLLRRPIHTPAVSSGTPPPIPPAKARPGLRDRAGLAFDRARKPRELPHHAADAARPEGSQPPCRPPKPSNMRTRTQLERTQMSHRESAIALELLEDLAIPLEELTASQPETGQQPEIRNLLLEQPQLQAIMARPSTKSLSRQRPSQLSAEDVRIQDILKELSDSLLRKIDSFASDFELLRWLDQQVLSQTRPAPASPQTGDDSNPGPSTQLGQVFESFDALESDVGLEIDLEQDPEKILQQPLCFTPLFSPILLHLLESFSGRFKNPQLALYLFDWVRLHPDPLVKYFGLTRDVYYVILRIKWDAFHDFGGIHNDLAEMKALGLELDDRFKRLVQRLAQAVLEDEVQAERRLATPLDRLATPEAELGRRCKISPVERFHVSQIEAILNQFIESQNDAMNLRLRTPPPSPNQP